MTIKNLLFPSFMLLTIVSFGQFSGEKVLVDCDICRPVLMLVEDINANGLKDVLYYSGIKDNIYWLEKKSANSNEYSGQQLLIENIRLADLQLHDLNGDNKLDIIIKRPYPKTIDGISSQFLWFMNLGDANFSNPLPLSGKGEAIKFVDIDKDGDLDILKSKEYKSGYERELWLEYNDGDGNFLSEVQLGQRTKERSDAAFFAVDFDKDEDLDIVTAQYIYINEGSGFEVKDLYFNNEKLENYYRLEPCDIDGDNQQDIILRSPNTEQVYWYERDTAENLMLQSLIVENIGRVVEFIDFDEDGDQDLIYSKNEIRNNLVWYVNDGTGTFSDSLVMTQDFIFPTYLGFDDFDNDEDLDFIVGSHSDCHIEAFTNQGYTAFEGNDLVKDDLSSIYDLHPADFNKDNKSDFVISSRNKGEVVWYMSKGEGQFEQHILPQFIPGLEEVHPVDINGDGWIDIVAVSAFTGDFFWFQNLNGSGFSDGEIMFEGFERIEELKSGDLDNDGDEDLVSIYPIEIFWHENQGNGQFIRNTIASDRLGFRSDLEIVDIDNDGDLDILTASGKSIEWYKGADSNNFRTVERIPTSLRYISDIVIEDLDNDGDLDIISDGKVSQGNKRHSVWLENVGSGNFVERIIDTNIGGGILTVFDFDGDNDNDLISFNGGRVTISKNDGTGNFYVYQLDESFDFYNVTSGASMDVDADGQLDLIYSSAYEQKVIWLKKI